MSEWTNPSLSRRACLSILVATAAWSATARAQASQSSFEQWVAAIATFRDQKTTEDGTTWTRGPIWTCVYRELRFGRIDDATRRPGHATQLVRSAELSERPAHP